MYWYVIFVKTGREERVKWMLNKSGNDMFIPFIPMLETLFIASGQVRKEIKPLFPGYIFVESEILSNEFREMINSIYNTSDEIIRILSYGDMNEIALREDEKNMLLCLCNDKYCIESSYGIIEGDNICIYKGPLKGIEGIIKKIDRHKRRAFIEFEFMGAMRQVSVGLQIVKKQ